MFDEKENAPGLPVLKKGLKFVKNAQDFVDCILLDTNQVVPPGKQPPNTRFINPSHGKTNKKLKNLLADVSFHMEMLGLFGGSQACLAHIINLECLREKAEGKLTKDVYGALITTLMAVR